MVRRGWGVVLGLLGLGVGASASGQVVTLTPSADNTLYESTSSEVSNAVGGNLYCGLTNIMLLRRALIRFDLSSIPADATITGVQLRLFLNLGQGGMLPCELHRVTSDWGQGTSNAGDPGGVGAPATSGDPTWVSSFFGTQLWQTPGGDFVPEVSAVTLVDGPGATYTWSSDGMALDVQQWLSGSAGNFGWVLLGAETVQGSALRFTSVEGLNRPQLVVTYTAPPQCGPSDFNQDGDVGTDQDIEAFFACLGGNCCSACWPGGADFNADGGVGTDQDIESFFRVLGGSVC